MPKAKINNKFTKNCSSETLKVLSRRLALSYYWSKWRAFTAMRKTNQQLDWHTKIDGFLYRMQEIKTQRLPPVVDEHKKSKKKPSILNVKRQETNDDLKKLSNEIITSTETTYAQLKSKSIQEIHPSLRGKAKLIRAFSAMNVPQSPKIRMYFPTPEILLKMNEREKERKKRWEMLKAKKRQEIEERDRVIEERYKQQLAFEEMEKRRKIAEFKEKQRQRKIMEERRTQYYLKYKLLNDKALRHYKGKLLKDSFECWMQFVFARKMRIEIAKTHFELSLKKKTFIHWRQNSKISRERKEFTAYNFYNRLLLRKYFKQWRMTCYETKMKWHVAEDWFELRLVEDYFLIWLNFTKRQGIICRERSQEALEFYKRKLLQKCFKCWISLPAVMRNERELEERKRKWRYKVREVLPDFQLDKNWEVKF